MCRKEECIGHTYTTEVLRVSVEFVVYGPDNIESAVRRAVQGFAAVCAATAVNAAKAAAAAAAATPAAQIAAALGMGIGTFKSCVFSVKEGAVIAAALNQFEFTIVTPTYWARI